MQGRTVDSKTIVSAFAHLSSSTLDHLLDCHHMLTESLPPHEQCIRWNTIAFLKRNPRKSAHDCICCLAPRRDRIELGFYLGSLFKDPARLLKGSTKYKRFVPLQKPDQLRNPLIVDLLNQSLKLVHNGWKHSDKPHSPEYLELIRGI